MLKIASKLLVAVVACLGLMLASVGFSADTPASKPAPTSKNATSTSAPTSQRVLRA